MDSLPPDAISKHSKVLVNAPAWLQLSRFRQKGRHLRSYPGVAPRDSGGGTGASGGRGGAGRGDGTGGGGKTKGERSTRGEALGDLKLPRLPPLPPTTRMPPLRPVEDMRCSWVAASHAPRLNSWRESERDEL